MRNYILTGAAFALFAFFATSPATASDTIMDNSDCIDCLTMHLSQEMVTEDIQSCPVVGQDVRGYFAHPSTMFQTDIEQSIQQSKEDGGI